LMAKDEVTLPLLEVSQRQRERYREQAQKCATKFLYRALEIMNRCDINYRQSSNKRLLVELTLIEVAQITQPEDDSGSSGRSPKRLKSLFKNLIIPQPKAAIQVAHEEKHSPTPSGPRLKLGNIGISFSDLQREKKSQSGQQEEESARNEAKNHPFGPDELDMQWIVMCNQLPQKQTAMAARMKNMSIRITDFPHIEVLADNEIMLEQVRNLKDWIRIQLASLLHNDNLDISIRLAKAEEMRKILTPKETFENMRKENPAIEKLKEMLNLELT
jgi:DNA polymerase III, gamma and tau subunit